MFLKVLFIVSLLSIVGAIHADHCSGPATPQLSLCQEFQMMRDLVPRASILRLIQSHMENDLRFRKAVQYMRSPEFKTTVAKVDSTATFQSFLRPFDRAGVNTTDIKSVGNIFDCIIQPIIGSRSSFKTENVVETRSLDSFAQEVARLIPTDELVKALKTQVAKNKQFAKFYEVVRDPSFRTKVMKGFNNRDISRPIKTLRRFQIDLPKLTEYAFNLLYLGPDV